MMNHLKHLLGMAQVFGAMAEPSRPSSAMQRELARKFCDNPECKKEYNHKGRYCSKECKVSHDKILVP